MRTKHVLLLLLIIFLARSSGTSQGFVSWEVPAGDTTRMASYVFYPEIWPESSQLLTFNAEPEPWPTRFYYRSECPGKELIVEHADRHRQRWEVEARPLDRWLTLPPLYYVVVDLSQQISYCMFSAILDLNLLAPGEYYVLSLDCEKVAKIIIL